MHLIVIWKVWVWFWGKWGWWCIWIVWWQVQWWRLFLDADYVRTALFWENRYYRCLWNRLLFWSVFLDEVVVWWLSAYNRLLDILSYFLPLSIRDVELGIALDFRRFFYDISKWFFFLFLWRLLTEINLSERVRLIVLIFLKIQWNLNSRFRALKRREQLVCHFDIGLFFITQYRKTN